MSILRVLKQQYELLGSTDVVRGGKAAMQNAGLTLIQRMISIADGSTLTGLRFLGGALTPSATGLDATVSLRPGVVAEYDSAEADEWIGNWKWSAQPTTQSIAMATNNDASGDDRIDAIAVRMIQVEEDTQPTKIKDPTTGNVVDESHPQRVRHDLEFKIFEGSPAPAPSAPSIDAGWTRVADVLRQNGVVNVATSDVTDQREGGETFLDGLRVTGTLSTPRRILLGDHDDDALQLENDDADNPFTLTLSKIGGGIATFVASKVDATDSLETGKIRTDGVSTPETVEVKTEDDADYARVVAKNTPLAMTSFYFPDPGGALSDGASATITYDYNIDAITYNDDTSDYVEITFDTAIPEGVGAVAMVCYGEDFAAGDSPPTENLSIAVQSGGTSAYMRVEGGGAPDLDQEFHVVVYGA